jgi:hypothetical protein
MGKKIFPHIEPLLTWNDEDLEIEPQLTPKKAPSPLTSWVLPQPQSEILILHKGNHFRKLIALRAIFKGEFMGEKPRNINETEWVILEGIKNNLTLNSSKGLLDHINLFCDRETTPTGFKITRTLCIKIPLIFDFYCRSVGINGIYESQTRTKVMTQSNHFRWWSYDRTNSKSKRSIERKFCSEPPFPFATTNQAGGCDYGLNWVYRKIVLPQELTHQEFCARLSPIECMEMIDRICLRILTLCFGEWRENPSLLQTEYRNSISYIKIPFQRAFQTAVQETITEYSSIPRSPSLALYY